MDPTSLRTALELLDGQEPFVWLSIVDSLGSSPRHAGTAMLVRADGTSVGTIGGGPLEAAAMRAAAEVIVSRSSRLMQYDLTGDDPARLGMICGGRGLVLVDFVDPDDRGVLDYFTALRDLLATGGRGWTAVTVPTDLEAPWTARRCLLAADGTLSGTPPCPAETLLDFVKPGGTRDAEVAGPGTTTYAHPVGAQGAAYVFGAGHCGEKLIPLLSSVGFYSVVVDDREEFANPERFPTADRIVVPPSFDGVVPQLPIDTDSYLVIVTRGHVWDKSVLDQALDTNAGYIGMIGSKRKIASIFDALRDSGRSDEQLSRVFAPIGIEIAAETPEEIAVSIAAQLVQVRAAGRS